MRYPSAIRDRFDNNVENLATFLSDSKNDAEAIKLGLKQAPLEAKPTKEAKPSQQAESVSNAQPEAEKTK